MTAAVPVTKLGAYGGGGWCWADADTVVYAAVDGRLLGVPRAGGPLRELATGATAAAPACSCDSFGPPAVAFVRESDDSCRIAVVPLAGGVPPVEVSDADYAGSRLVPGRSLARVARVGPPRHALGRAVHRGRTRRRLGSAPRRR